MWFGYNCEIIFCHFFHFVNFFFVCHFLTSMYRQWVPCERNFYTDLFKTLHMFSPWSEDVHVVWI